MRYKNITVIKKWLLGATALVLIALGGAATFALLPTSAADTKDSAVAVDPSSSGEAQYVGAESCNSCHKDQAAEWRQSHHAKAMQHASSQTVLGDFNNATLRHSGTVSSFFKRDGKYFVHTDGHDNKPAEYEVRYTFGIFPLQQYLVELPGGRVQALGTAWDARPKAQGGQRWFHLYPDQKLKAGDSLHWSGRDQNWNFMCASCHSTNLQRNYDLTNDSYKTTWSEINVACEACHGPGSRHVAWVHEGKKVDVVNGGFALRLRTGNGLSWKFSSAAQKIASPQPQAGVQGAGRHDETETCFPCHSRRQDLSSIDKVDQPFLDRYQPSLLERGQYHADGQIDGEVFEFGAFTQSKMYMAGVTCSNCHLPHSLKLRAKGNALCSQCHQASHYDRPEHHHHQVGKAGAECVDCHMPTKTYMGVDQRRDHGFHVPRPNVSERNQTPNACIQCHTGKSLQWAKIALNRWSVKGNDGAQRLASGIDAAWKGSVRTDSLLATLAADTQLAPIQRATILSLLPSTRSPLSLGQIAYGASSEVPIIRLGAARGLANLEPQLRAQIGLGLLGDPLRAIRVEAARALADIPRQRLSLEQRVRLDAAIEEAIAAELTAAERPESHINLGQLYLRLNRPDDAERELKTALRLAPRFIPAFINLADLHRLRNQDIEGEKLLHDALLIDPQAASPLFALALLKVRQSKRAEALELLGKAARLEPHDAQYAYVYAVALHGAGDSRKALNIIEAARKNAPEDGGLLQLQIGIEQKLGLKQAAAHQAELSRLVGKNGR